MMTRGRRSNVTLFLTLVFVLLLLQCDTGNGQKQSFRQKPVNTDVVRNQTATLHCSINHRAGKVQWAKDGFVLGFDRQIPGYPRYSIVGSETAEEYNLQIRNAAIEDDGEFQCQVGPAPDNSPIRADARLTVLLPPVMVKILNKPEGGSLEIEAGEKLELICLVERSKPAAKIRWLRNDYELSSDKEDYSVEDVEGKRQNAKSKITIIVSPDDNRATYTCEGLHPALTESVRAQLKLSVLHPPSAPEIIGYQIGEVVKKGDHVALECVSRGGNPLAELVWHKNGQMVDHSYTTSGQRSVNVYQFNTSEDDNGANFTCTASNRVTKHPKPTTVTLSVHYAPSKVTITGPKEAKVGDVVTLKCETDKSYPAANVSWVVDGRPVSSSSVSEPKEKGYVTKSEATVTVPRMEGAMTISCYAIHHILGQTIVEVKQLSVLYPPNPPTIVGYSEGTSIKAGSVVKLTCVASGGNPPATLKWLAANKEVAKAEPKPGDKVVSLDYTFISKAEDNLMECRCEASNSATVKPYNSSVKLTVHFPPKGVTISITPKKSKAGRKVTLQCDSSSSNPASKISWWRDGFTITGVNNGTQNALYGGKTTRSTLQFTAASKDDGAVYTCQATNEVLQHNVHDAITLDVQYKPEFVNIPSSSVVVIEGESTEVNFTAKSNPTVTQYKWMLNGAAITSTAGSVSTLYAIGAVLNITRASRSDRGNYTCEAKNSEGTTTATLVLDVHYPAQVTKVTNTVMVDEGSSAYFECESDANPKPSGFLTWKRDSYDMTRVKQNYINGKSYLTITNVNKDDSGYFVCAANNGIGTASEKNGTLIVKFKPIIDKTSPYSKAASEHGQRARVVCRAQGAPSITFTWSREGATLSSPNKYETEVTQVDLITWEGVLHVSKIQNSDYGFYECVARNEQGFATWKIKLDGTSFPDPPLVPKVLNVTHNSALISWNPGFDGGLVQSFRIRYRSKDSLVYLFTDVYPSNGTTYLVTNLELGTEYTFNVMAFNDKGSSNYTTELVQARTLSEIPLSEKEKVITHVLRGKGEIPRIVIITVSVVGTFLLVLNVTLVICFIRRRRRKRMEDESSEQSSSKAATIEMYAPSSYNGTITGETLSSISEKSETYSEDNVTEEYLDDGCKPSGTYLTDSVPNIDPYPTEAPTYISYRNDNPGSQHNTLTRTSKPIGAHIYESEDFTYADALRRNAYNNSLGEKVILPKSPPNPPIRSVSHKDPYYNTSPEARYVPYPTVPPITPLLSTFNPNPQEMSTTPLVSPQGTDAPPGLLPEMAGHLV